MHATTMRYAGFDLDLEARAVEAADALQVALDVEVDGDGLPHDVASHVPYPSATRLDARRSGALLLRS